jgi:hypothetical protein
MQRVVGLRAADKQDAALAGIGKPFPSAEGKGAQTWFACVRDRLVDDENAWLRRRGTYLRLRASATDVPYRPHDNSTAIIEADLPSCSVCHYSSGHRKRKGLD